MQVLEPPTKARVAVFCRTFLPLSQTFVYDAVTRLTRYRASIFALERANQAQFPFDDVRLGGFGYGNTTLSWRFASAFRRERFELVHAQFGTSAVYALPYAEQANLPLVVSFHGYDVPLLERARPIRGPARQYAWRGKAALRRMTLGLCASLELKQMLIEQGVPEEKLRVHRLGIDTARFEPAPDGPPQVPLRVLMVGRFVEKKGFAYGLQAFARAADKSAELTLIGEGPLADELRALATALGVQARVTFTGVVPHAKVLEAMRRHHVLLAPSVVARDGDRDSGLIVLREAAACELVPIASLHGGLPDSVEDGISGYLVPERDVEAIADRLNRLAADPVLRARLGRASREKMIREFDHSVSTPVLEQAYDAARLLHQAKA